MAGEEDQSIEIQFVPGELQGAFFVKADPLRRGERNRVR